MSGRRSVLIVHGRSFKPAEHTLRELAVEALRAGLERDFPECVSILDSIRIELGYYGDLSNELLAAHGGQYDEQIDVGDRRNALAALKDIPNRKRFGIRQYDRLPGKSAFAEFLADVFVPVFGLAGLWMWMCSRKAPDLAEYLRGKSQFAANARARIREGLAELLANGDDVLLITHGIGSALAWDVLWQLSHDERYSANAGGTKIDLWLTLGSPLGDRQLRKRLFGASEAGFRRFPTNVISWYNVAAEDDYICHDNTLADDFRNMLSEHAVSAVQDFKIYNHAVRYGKSNPHSSVGYYIHPRVSKILADWLQKGAPVSPHTPE